jgi:3-oxoadipate enol-lactonase
MPFAKLPDGHLHYEWAGPERAPVLLFSNSLGATIQMWEPQIAECAKYFRVLRYDTRGHGQSAVTAGPYTIEQLSNDVLHLLDVLGLQQVNFCGLSMGGLTGMHLGFHASKRFHKIVLCNTAAKIGTEENWNARIKAVGEVGIKILASSIVERWLTAPYRAEHLSETAALQAMLESANPAGYIANCAAVRDADERGTLSAVKVRTLVVVGTHDPVATPADGRFLVENIPGAKFIELAAAHLSNIEAQSDFNREVVAFLRA